MASMLCVTTFLLAGCHDKPFRTSIKNLTGQKIYLVVQFRDPELPRGHGDLDANGFLDLTQEISEILYIDYRIDGRNCRLDKSMIARAAHPDLDPRIPRKMNIGLLDCQESSRR